MTDPKKVNMNWKHAWLIFLVCFGFVANAQNDRITQLHQACKQFDLALVTKDRAKLTILLLNHFRMKHSNGFEETKKELLQHLNEGFLKYDEILQDGDAEIHLEEELGFVTRYLKVKGSLKGNDFNVKMKATELWTWNYTSRQWQLRNRQSVKTN